MLRRTLTFMLFPALLAGCGDPLRDVARIGEVALPEDAAEEAVVAAPEADSRPLLARVFGGNAPEPGDPPVGASGDSSAAAQEADAALGAEPRRHGLLGLFRRERSAGGDKIAPGAEAEIAPASLAPEGSDSAEEEDAAGRGLFGGLFSPRKAARLTGSDKRAVAPGTQLAFGEIARVCEIGREDMGREVARSGGGAGTYRLYDSVPDGTALRPFYITGFADGCPRTVSAALVIFGAPSHYEALRESGAKKGRDRGAADRAYDRARRKLCGARIGRDCSARARALERNTAFVTVYDRFGSARNWRDILLHDGAVLAMDDT